MKNSWDIRYQDDLENDTHGNGRKAQNGNKPGNVSGGGGGSNGKLSLISSNHGRNNVNPNNNEYHSPESGYEIKWLHNKKTGEPYFFRRAVGLMGGYIQLVLPNGNVKSSWGEYEIGFTKITVT